VTDPVDVAVIGAGPAGCAASVQAVKLGLSAVLIDETGEPGGLVRNAYLVENYIGLDPVPGHVLAAKMADHLERFDIRVTRSRIDNVRRNDHLLLAEGSDLLVRCRSLIMATGTVPLSGCIEGEATAGNVYFSPAEIPSPFPGVVAVVGGGEAAFDYALSTAKEDADTMLLVRGSEPKAAGRLLAMVSRNNLIRILYDTSVRSVTRAGDRLMLHVSSKNGISRIPVDALLIAVGRRRTHPVTEDGLLVDSGDELRGAEGAFTAGDVRSGRLGQACSAAGQGILAAAKAFEYIGKKGSGQ
jgi:thioredoxin reductase (NADPH)